MSTPAIAFEHVNFAYPEGPPVLRDVSVSIPAGQAVALVGINGSGKSTLLRHLIGLLHPGAGTVRINGVATAAASTGALARQVGFAFQQPEQQLFSPTVRAEIAFGPRNLGLRGAALRARVDETLARFDLERLAEHPPAVLSFSLRRLVALASIAALHTPILALDEPLVGLDGLWRRRVIAWLNQHHDSGGTTLLVTHHVRLAGKAERILVMDGGRLVADGPPTEVFARPETLEDAGLSLPFSVALGHALGLPCPTLLVREVAEAVAGRKASHR
ncbi:MAG: ATP-binding cassette domain-containing protein, partial [Anaerolineae bacterium]|nr:ATP-binding cassette domain-containing protein [Anaerolineae bacterium]